MWMLLIASRNYPIFYHYLQWCHHAIDQVPKNDCKYYGKYLNKQNES